MISILSGLLLGSGMLYIIYKKYFFGIFLIILGFIFAGFIFISNGLVL